MRPYASTRLLLFGAGLFAAGMAIATALVAPDAPPRADIPAGTTLAGFLPDDVLSLSYATPWGMTTTQRSLQTAAFQMLSTFADGRTAQRCTASPAMAGRLAGLSLLEARRALSPRQREQEFPALLGVIEIRNAGISKPGGPVVVYANRNRTAVAVVVDDRAAEVALPASELRWLETACVESVAGSENQHGGDEAMHTSSYRQPDRSSPVAVAVADDRQAEGCTLPRHRDSAARGGEAPPARAGKAPRHAAAGVSGPAQRRGARPLPRAPGRAVPEPDSPDSQDSARRMAAVSKPSRELMARHVVEALY